jgi:hypothetical protein
VQGLSKWLKADVINNVLRLEDVGVPGEIL